MLEQFAKTNMTNVIKGINMQTIPFPSIDSRTNSDPNKKTSDSEYVI